MKVLSALATAVAFVLVGVGPFGAFAEDPSAVHRKALETFSGARDQRSKLLSEIPRLKDAVDDVKRRKMSFAQLQSEKQRSEDDLARVGQDLKRTRKDLEIAPPNDTPRIRDRIRGMEEFEASAKSRLAFTEICFKRGRIRKRSTTNSARSKRSWLRAKLTWRRPSRKSMSSSTSNFLGRGSSST